MRIKITKESGDQMPGSKKRNGVHSCALGRPGCSTVQSQQKLDTAGFYTDTRVQEDTLWPIEIKPKAKLEEKHK